MNTESGGPNVIVPATVVLILSSVVCQAGVRAVRRGDQKTFMRTIAVTIAMGVGFLLLHAYDYSVLVSECLTLGGGPFGSTYFTLTGFHGAHVAVGASC